MPRPSAAAPVRTLAEFDKAAPVDEGLSGK